MPTLTITQGENKGESCTFEEQVILGRAPDPNSPFLLLKDLRASRKHARVVKIENNFYLEDMNSQNGTILNGQRIKDRIQLKNCDNIRIGNTWISFTIENQTISVGEVFAGYHISKEICKEESGTIYLAIQSSLERNVILWVLPREIMANQEKEQAKKNFIKQISTGASLFHRNIMMLMDFSILGEYYYCVFEAVDFDSNIINYLQKNNGPSSLDEVLDIAIQVARGMAYAHEHDVLHLHLTPKNVLIQCDAYRRVVLTEFGVSRFLSEITKENSQTSTGVLGVSEYIAPEQIHGNFPESKATDIYSYGCLLYHLIAGVPPFEAAEAAQLMIFHVQSTPKFLLEVRQDIPQEIARLVHTCMEKDPAKRYPSFQAIQKELEALEQEREFLKMLECPEGKEFIKREVGERILCKWWIILPILSIVIGGIIFFLLPLLF